MAEGPARTALGSSVQDGEDCEDSIANKLFMSNDPGRELFEACKNGDLGKVKKLVDPSNVNSKDSSGRRSSPLHFAAGMLPSHIYFPNLFQTSCTGTETIKTLVCKVYLKLGLPSLF